MSDIPSMGNGSVLILKANDFLIKTTRRKKLECWKIERFYNSEIVCNAVLHLWRKCVVA